MSKKQIELRIIHNMARSGSTLICKCIGCMDHIILLSEIHPNGSKLFNPLIQANDWFQLLNSDDLIRIRQAGQIDFIDAIELIQKRCDEIGSILVLRDWAHLDFTGIPFVQKPPYRFRLSEVVESRYDVRKVAIVRHPIDQWLSLRKLAIMQGKISLSMFLEGYLEYAQAVSSMEFIRYEDFVMAPDMECRRLCRVLRIPYDPAFMHKWVHYKTITGEVNSARGTNRIAPVPRRPVEEGLLDAFEKSRNYQRAIRLLGYPHETPSSRERVTEAEASNA